MGIGAELLLILLLSRLLLCVVHSLSTEREMVRVRAREWERFHPNAGHRNGQLR